MSDRQLREVLEETQRRLREAEAQLAEVTAMQTRMAAIEAALRRAKEGVSAAPRLACLRCGATDVAQSASIAVRGRAGQELFVVTLGDPQATFDTEPVSGEVVGNVCGHCGTVEIGTAAGSQLFETWKPGVSRQGAQ